jgi:nitrogen fixation/metabolism regulation signal transduction histidine kinase
MSKLTTKVTLPIILVGLFSISVFVALNYNQLGVGFYVVLFLLTIYIFSFGFAIGQSFSSPVARLLEKAKELSKGNLSSRVFLETKDELSELANVFNKIAEELEESHIDEQMIEKSTDIKTRARTQVLEETIGALESKVKNRTAELEKFLGESKIFQDRMKEKEVEIIQLKSELEALKAKEPKPKIRKIAKKKIK